MRSPTIYIDPAYSAYQGNKLFDETDPILNRDNSLAPFIRLRSILSQQGVHVFTADNLLVRGSQISESVDYYSMGLVDNFRSLAKRPNVHLKAFVIFEPPVVAPHLYKILPELTGVFDRVYLHNIDGDGFSLTGVDDKKLRKLFWPQPHADVFDYLWNVRSRQRRIVVINSNHKPASLFGELYSKRIQIMADLALYGIVDLFGKGWQRWWSRNSMWPPYWRNIAKIMSIYKGSCVFKLETLSQYDFALCFENMEMKGYITEKIFDCFYSGTIPIYWGAKDIENLIPASCYIDFRNFSSVSELIFHLNSIKMEEIECMREAGRNFIRSSNYSKYYDFLIDLVRSQ